MLIEFNIHLFLHRFPLSTSSKDNTYKVEERACACHAAGDALQGKFNPLISLQNGRKEAN
jgi:hypothetical protein